MAIHLWVCKSFGLLLLSKKKIISVFAVRSRFVYRDFLVRYFFLSWRSSLHLLLSVGRTASSSNK
jgi:hypothetical protein